jgi:hypothetical protein
MDPSCIVRYLVAQCREARLDEAGHLLGFDALELSGVG